MAPKKSKTGKISRKTKSWSPVLDLKPGRNRIKEFTTEEALAIWQAAGLERPMPVELPDDLSRARSRYMIELHQQQKPTTTQLAQQTERIADLTVKLLDALLIDGKLRSGLGAGGLWARAVSKSDPTGAVAVKEACEGVANLGHWAKAMSDHQFAKLEVQTARKGEDATDKRTVPADTAVNSLVAELAGIYMVHSGEMPRLSRNKGKPSGFFSFVFQTFQFMELPQTEEAIALLIRRHGQMEFEEK